MLTYTFIYTVENPIQFFFAVTICPNTFQSFINTACRLYLQSTNGQIKTYTKLRRMFCFTTFQTTTNCEIILLHDLHHWYVDSLEQMFYHFEVNAGFLGCGLFHQTPVY